MCLRASIRSFKPPELHFLFFYHNLEVDKDCLVTQLCLFCIVISLKILASYTLLPLLMYSCKFQLRNYIFIILYTITCALNDQSCRCAIKQHSFIHSFVLTHSANYLLIENGVIRRYVRSIDLEYRQLFNEGEGTVEYFLRILKRTPTVFNAKNILVIRKFQSY